MQKESYDVLRLIEHGQICYISSDHVHGKILAVYLKYHPMAEKKELFSMMKEIARQLELIHRCRGNPCYQYVNPYSIVRAEEGQIYFLDMQAESNQEQILFMQRREIREHFLPPDEKYYQHASQRLDIYGLGKTFQYILASTEAGPHLKRREEYQLKRMISKSLGTHTFHYLNLSEIQKQIPNYKEKTKTGASGKKRKRGKLAVIALLVMIAAGGQILMQQRKNDTGKKSEEVRKKQKSEPEIKQRQAKTLEAKQKNGEEYLELAMAYFLNVGDIGKSLNCLEKLEDTELAENLKVLIKAYEKQRVPEDERAYKKSLDYLEERWKKRSEVSEEKRKQEIHCLVRGYGCLEDVQSAEKLLELVKEGLQMEYLNDPVKKEFLQYQAGAFERLEKEEEAANVYKKILEMELQPGSREQLYKKMTQLYEAAGRRDMAGDVCIQGIQEQKDSEELKLMYIRLLCADTSVSREECAQKIKEYTGTDTKILENEEFKKLQKEYEIKVEGENVWVGR